MLGKVARLFTIRTRWEAYLVIYAIAVGATSRGFLYVEQYPGPGGWLLFAACTGVVFMAGAKLLDMTRKDSGTRRRRSDLALAGSMTAVPLAAGGPASELTGERGALFQQDIGANLDAEPRNGGADVRVDKGGVGATGNAW